MAKHRGPTPKRDLAKCHPLFHTRAPQEHARFHELEKVLPKGKLLVSSSPGPAKRRAGMLELADEMSI